MDPEGKYIYCLTEMDGSPAEFGPIGLGGRGDVVYMVPYKDICAAVSSTRMRKYSVTREHSMAHMRVIEEVMKGRGVLPVRFCTIAESEEQVKRILEREYENFKSSLGKIREKEEIGLKAVLSEDIYQDIIAGSGEIRTLKETIYSKPPDASYHLRVKIGRMVQSALERVKESCREDILKALSPLSDEVKVNREIGDRMAVNAAFLVDKSREKEFDERVAELDGRYGDGLKMKYVCNLPPYNFINISINIKEYNASCG